MKLKIAIISIITLIISIFVYVQYISYISYIPESTTMNVIKEKYKSKIEKEVPGSTFVSTHLYLTDLLLNKRGGYTHNDLYLMKAIEYDFKEVLEKKNALPSLRQIIRELEAVQREVSPPIVLNGEGYGWFANHSLVAANYISRANAAIIDLKNLLENG